MSVDDLDPHTTAGKLADLLGRDAAAVHAGSAAAVERQHAKGKGTARERIDALLDPGSFVELDRLARHRSVAFDQASNRPYGDGVITGYGTIDGRQVCVFSQDFTVFGGSLGEVFGEKIVKVMDLAMKVGCPVIGINDSGGARIQEGVVSLGLYAEIFYRNTIASGVIPQISLVLGPCAGGAVYSPAITDFIIMVDQTSHMFITGPDVIKTVTGEDVEFEELGGALTHNSRSGVAHYLATDEADAIDFAKALLSYFPSNNVDDAPVFPVEAVAGVTATDLALDTLIPDSASQPYDIHTVIKAVLDDAEFLETQALFAPNIVCGLGRVDGRSVGVVANQPLHYAGCLDIDASEKAARFVRTCDAFNIPILTFVDVPGFLPGTGPGMERHHPTRRETAVRVRRGDCAEGDGHHPQGVRRRVRRHGEQAPARRREPRVADCADRSHGCTGRGEHLVPQGISGVRVTRERSRGVRRTVRGPSRQSVHRRRARLRRRRDRSVADQTRGQQRAADPAHQARPVATEEAREHSAVTEPVEVTKGNPDDEELAAVAMALEVVAARPLSSEPESGLEVEVIASRRLGEDFSGEAELGALVEGTATFVLVEVVDLDPLRTGVRVVGREHRRWRTDRIAQRDREQARRRSPSRQRHAVEVRQHAEDLVDPVAVRVQVAHQFAVRVRVRHRHSAPEVAQERDVGHRRDQAIAQRGGSNRDAATLTPTCDGDPSGIDRRDVSERRRRRAPRRRTRGGSSRSVRRADAAGHESRFGRPTGVRVRSVSD